MNPCYHSDLKTQKDDDVARFTFKGQRRYAKVVSVYDGDICDLVFYQDGGMNNLVRYKCRMLDYNAPELNDNDVGKLTRDYFAWLCMGGDPIPPR
jgi:hypothetical protein